MNSKCKKMGNIALRDKFRSCTICASGDGGKQQKTSGSVKTSAGCVLIVPGSKQECYSQLVKLLSIAVRSFHYPISAQRARG
jgi:hypothetical protein